MGWGIELGRDWLSGRYAVLSRLHWSVRKEGSEEDQTNHGL
jgi:hypothetical protein